MRGSRKFHQGVFTIFFLCQQRISQRIVPIYLEKQLDPQGSNCFFRGSIPYFQGNLLAICSFQIGGGGLDCFMSVFHGHKIYLNLFLKVFSIQLMSLTNKYIRLVNMYFVKKAKRIKMIGLLLSMIFLAFKEL